MALMTVVAKKQPVVASSGRAALTVTDPAGNPPILSGVPRLVADDAGRVIALSVDGGGQIVAHPVGAGTATVTWSLTEAGVPQTGTAKVTVAPDGTGRLQAAWVMAAGVTLV